MTKPISLSSSSFYEGQIGSKIGTLSCGGLSGTYEITDQKWKHNGSPIGFIIKGNDLYFADGWMFDYEGGFVQKGDYFGTWWALGNSLNIKFTSNSGTVVQNDIKISITDVNEKVTATPYKVYKDVYGATIADLSADWNFFSQITMGYNNSHTFFEIDQSGKKLKLKDTFYFNGTSVKDSAGNSTAITNLGEIKLNVLGGQTTPGNDSNHGDTIISVNDLATKFFNSGNVDEKANKPVISIDNTEILESISGVKIGTLFAGDKTGVFALQNPNNALTIINDELYLSDGYLLDYESGKVLNNTTGSWVDTSWNKNITINFTSNTFKGDTVKSVKHLIDNATEPVTSTIKLSTSFMMEGQSGAKIGTLSCGNLSGTFSLDADYFKIKGNDLYLREGYMFDHESNAVIADARGWSWTWGWSNNNLSIKFTADDGTIIQNAITIGITNATETVTVTPQTVYTNVYGATIGTVSADWNIFTHPIMGWKYQGHDYFELSEEFDQTFAVGNTTGLSKSPDWGSWVKAEIVNNYGSKLQYKQLKEDGTLGDAQTIWAQTWTYWFEDTDVYRIEDTSGNFISEIYGGGGRYVIDADRKIHKYDNCGKELKLKDEYYFDGTSIKDKDGNSKAIADLGDIRINVRGGQAAPSVDSNRGDTVITVSTLASSFFNSGNTSAGSNRPGITISDSAIFEGLPGATIGTLSAGDKEGTFSLTNSENYLIISGNDLKLADGVALDYESSKLFDSRSGSWQSSTWSPSISITLTESNGAKTTSVIKTTIVDLNEKINVTPVNLTLNKFGAIVAQLSTNSVQLKDIVLGYTNSNDYFEIANNQLKLKNAYSYDGSVIKDSSGNSFDIKQIPHVKLAVSGGATTLESTPSTSQQTFTTSIFDLNESLTINPKAFFSNDYGEAIASVTSNSLNYFSDVNLSTDTIFEYTNGELKLKSNYAFDGKRLIGPNNKEYSLNHLETLVLVPVGTQVTSNASNSNIPSISKQITASDLKTYYFTDHNSLEAITNNFTTILGDGHKDNRIDVVVLGDGYTANELKYTQPQHLYNLTSELFFSNELQPFKAYKNYFNFHLIKVVSNQSGVDVQKDNLYVDTALNMSRHAVGIWDTPTDGGTAAVKAFNEGLVGSGYTNDQVDQVLFLLNTPITGGIAGLLGGSIGKGTVTQSGYPGMGGTLAHEFGHSIGGLGDEYIWKEYAIHGGHGDGITYVGSEPYGPNVTKDSSGQKWSHWKGYDDGILGSIGAFEGGYYHEKGVYTPTPGSIMGSANDAQNIAQFDAIGKEAMILGFYKSVTPLDDYSGKDYFTKIALSDTTILEAVSGALLGDLSVGNIQGTFSLATPVDYLTISNNQLRLADGYFIDKESSKVFTYKNNAWVSADWNNNITVNFNPTWKEYQLSATFTFSVKDLNETITLGYTPSSNSAGANIATLSTNSVHLTETNLGYAKTHDYFEVVNNTLKLKAGYSFDGSVIKDSNNQSIQLSSIDAITLGTPTSASTASGNGNTSITATDLMTNFANSSNANTIKLSTSSVKEGQSGINIGTLSCGNLSGTYSLDATTSNWKNYFEIKGNNLYIKEGYMFDHELYGMVADTYSGSWYWTWGNSNLSIRFTPSDGSAAIENSISLAITNVDESITVTAEKVYKNVFGATIGTINSNWNDFSRIIVKQHTFFEQSEEYEQTFQIGNDISLTKGPPWGSWWKAEIVSNYGSNGDLQYRLLGEDGNWGNPTNLWNGWNWYLLDNGIYRMEDRDGNFISEITGGGNRYVIDADGTIHKYVNKGNQLKLKDNYKFDGTSFIDTDGNTVALADLAGGKTFAVNKSASSTSDYKIDSADDPTLTLFRGKTYTFDMSGSGHPFYLKSTSSTSGTNDEYKTGVVRNGSSGSSNDGDSLVFTVPLDAPDTLWYQCSSHAGMLGKLTILDADIRVGVRGGLTTESVSATKGDTLITVTNLTNNFFKAGNTTDGDPIVNPTTLILDAVDESLLTFEWKIDGSTQSGKTTSKFDVAGAGLSDGTYKITAIAKDDSALVKLDKSSMTQTVDWVVKIDSSDATGQTYGTEGHDVITTGSKNDTLIVGAGDDQVTTGSGNDVINIGSGADVTDAGGNDDTIYLYADSTWTSKNEAWNINASKVIFNKIPLEGKNKFHDVINGNTGSDTLTLTKGSDAFFLHDAFGDFNSSLSVSDDAYGKKNTDRLISIETINGGAGDDIIDLTSPNTSISTAMVINGEAGADVIWASVGGDTLNGGEGNDILFGGAGIDTLTGGAGADTFEFEKSSGNDVIKDYNLSQGDKLKFYLQAGDPNSISLASGNTVNWGSLSLTFEGASFSSLSDISVEYSTVEA
ncbi:MAG: M64 family metallopeptidase [Paracoccaceae bacterium]|nr:M64 family metallopeptidase [Paracoccaceae bacterium]